VRPKCGKNGVAALIASTLRWDEVACTFGKLIDLNVIFSPEPMSKNRTREWDNFLRREEEQLLIVVNGQGIYEGRKIVNQKFSLCTSVSRSRFCWLIYCFSAKKNGEGDDSSTKVEDLTVSPPFINTYVVGSFNLFTKAE